MKTLSDYPLLLARTTPELYQFAFSASISLFIISNLFHRNILELVEKEKAQDDLFLKILQKVRNCYNFFFLF